MTKSEVITLISDTIETLTWNRLAMVITVCAFGVLMAFTFDNREQLLEQILGVQTPDPLEVGPWNLSATSRKELETLVDVQPLIGGVLIWDVDLKKNRATSIFLYPKKEILQWATTDLTLPQAFFDTEPKSRAQIISVISNSFTCSATEDVTFVKQLYKKFPASCFLAIPPYAGGFVGFIGLTLVRHPTENEKDALRIELTRIAINVYLRDIENKIPVKPNGAFP